MADDDVPVPPESDPSGEEPGGFNPFGAMPMFNELAKHLKGQGPLNWDAARQFALMTASGGSSEANVEPSERVTLTQLATIVGPQINDVGGFDLIFPEPRTSNRSQWSASTLDAYRPLFTELAVSLGATPDDTATNADPMAQMMANLNQLVGPGMMGMAVGSMVGTLAQRAFGDHSLPIPRDTERIELIPANINEFATQIELPPDEVRLWVLAHELAGYALFTIDAVRNQMSELVRHHVGGFQPDPNALSEKLSGLDTTGDPMESIQQAFSDPALLLGAVGSPAQQQLQPALNAATAAVIGFIDWIVDGVAVRLIGGNALTIAAAARERRASSTQDDAFVERLLGIRADDADITRAKLFVQDAVDRVGEAGFIELLGTPGSLPTQNELDAAGLWIERVQLTDGEPGSADGA